MGSVVDPFARRCDPLAGGDHRGVADDGDQFAVAARLDAQNAKTVLGVVKGDALDKACQNLPGRRFQLGLWRAVHEVPRSASVPSLKKSCFPPERRRAPLGRR